MNRLLHLIVLATLTLGCQGDVRLRPAEQVSAFAHDLKASAQPWKHEQFDASENKFTFAMFSDLTGGERERIFEVAVAQLNPLRPELILNVGDLVEGGSRDPAELHRQWDSFDERAGRARAPIFYVGGNHDLTGELLREVEMTELNTEFLALKQKDIESFGAASSYVQDHRGEVINKIYSVQEQSIVNYRMQMGEKDVNGFVDTLPSLLDVAVNIP